MIELGNVVAPTIEVTTAVGAGPAELVGSVTLRTTAVTPLLTSSQSVRGAISSYHTG